MSGIRRDAVGGLMVVLLLLAGCSSGPPDGIAFESEVEASRILETYAAELDFHANWMCELQRRTFRELSDIDTARDEALAAADLSASAYADFLVTLEMSQAARDYVRGVHDERCEA